MTTPDPYDEAVAALMANAASGELHEIRSIAARLGGLVKRLEKFSWPFVAASLAGLLTRPEHHCATARIEALIHLAALAGGGNKAPRPRHLRQWLNTMVSDDPICQLEVPVEDVFVSNVGTWGNSRLFDGRWKSNSDQVQLCVETLFRLQERPWAAQALRHIMALLRVSEAVAGRAGIARNSRTTSTPRETIAVSASDVAESSGHVHFSDDDLVAIGVDLSDLNPFVFRREHAELLGAQSIGHTALERRPLVRFRGHTTVALPTSIGAAIRRFAVERAATAGDLGRFQSTRHRVQFTEIFLLGGADWDIGHTRMLEPDPDDGMREFVGAFDDHAYVHVLFVPDDFEEVAREGLTSVHSLEDAVRERIDDRAAELAREVRCQRGLTVLVHGGIGREFAPVWGDLPDGWHQLCLSAPDFMLLGSETEFTAMRAWKLLEMVAELEAEGVVFPNLHGFLNVVAFADHVGCELVPKHLSPGPMLLHSDFILPLRHRVRTALDRHAAMGPDRNSWVDVQRDTKSEYLDEARGRLVFYQSCASGSRGTFGLRRIRLAAMVGPMQPASGRWMASRCRIGLSGHGLRLAGPLGPPARRPERHAAVRSCSHSGPVLRHRDVPSTRYSDARGSSSTCGGCGRRSGRHRLHVAVFALPSERGQSRRPPDDCLVGARRGFTGWQPGCLRC